MDPNMMIVKTLSETDCSHDNKLILPRDKVENIVRSTGVPVPRMGIQVEILDNTNSYWVNLRQSQRGYFIGRGWGELRDARNLKAGDVIKLYWQNTKFVFSM
nr:At1g08984 [Arabidopsis thaliana]BAC43235.1 unknown protein [Arabidopsis thaliana]